MGEDQQMAGRADRRATEGLDWVKLRKGLFVFCRSYHQLSVEDSEDVSQQAICRVFDPKLPGWDQQRYPNMKDWLGSIVNGLVVNLRRNVARKTEKLVREENPELQPAMGGAGVTNAPRAPDEAAITAERARKGVNRVLELLEGDALAADVVMLKVEDVDTAREQAEALKVDVAKVYRAREKVAAAAAQALREMED